MSAAPATAADMEPVPAWKLAISLLPIIGLGLIVASRGGRLMIEAWLTSLPVLVAACLLLAVVPDRRVRLVQEVALVALVGIQRWADPRLNLAGTAVGIAAVMAVASLPWGRPGWRRRGILGATGVLIGCFVVGEPAVGLLGPLIQSLFIITMTDGLSLRDGLRCGLIFSMVPAVSVPPPDVVRVDRRAASVLPGALWLVAGVVFCSWLSPIAWLPEGDPWRAIWRMEPHLAVRDSWLGWLHVYSVIGGRLMIQAGTLRLLGMPIGIPVDRPWAATDLLDYWRRSHTWRSRLFRGAYLQELGWSGPLAVWAVFTLSGIQHAVDHPGPLDTVAAWMVEGAVAAAVFAWQQRRARARVEAWMRLGRRPPRSALLAVVISLVVLAFEGLVHAPRPPRWSIPDHGVLWPAEDSRGEGPRER